jgi:long-chain acyl-CoA synthetase
MEINRIFDVLDYALRTYPRPDALASKVDGQWVPWSTGEYTRIADQISCGLLALGLKKGDKIVTASNNRPEWNFLDMGMMQIGIVHVPIYPTLSEEETAFILEHSDACLALVSDSALLKKFSKVKPSNIREIYTFNDIKGSRNWKEIAELGEKTEKEWSGKLPQIKASIQPSDLLTIIYTSGTTGVPKGVMLSHNNMVSNLMAVIHLFDMDHTERALSFLPLCHVFERLVHYGYQLRGYGLYYAESLGTIGADLKEIKAGAFVSVPRIIEVMYDKIIAKGKALKGIKRQVFFWAVNLGIRFEHNRANGWWYEFQRKIADKLVYVKWREGLGGSVKIAVSGGAALQPRLARVFHAAGIFIQEGYGLTETSPVIAVNERHYPDNYFGTVGPTLDNLEVKIGHDGEILVKGPSVMMGYYKNEELTRDVIDADGWFHTGDIGEFIEGRFLKITDRKKEIFKNSGGKYIAPQAIENKVKESFFIENCLIIGENQKFTSAIISPNFRFLHDYCTRKGLHYRDNFGLICRPEILARYQQEINEINKSLAPHEQIKRFRLVVDEWNAATGELSPTLKLKRNVLHQKYQAIIKDIYSMSKNDDE